ncbi:pilus assembly PilX family protein [Massilia sp. S19_KUP03_FR1]|uniref:pilus assembly PilX family protein n=1 Tax=Massilia sp. S19_KUP03_FR1 TaxID=3025503 RepID=UPI002FCD727A
MGQINKTGQQGIALPVMLIILVVMLISSVYLLKSSNSSTLSAANMAYDAALSKAADLGLHKGFQYLNNQSKVALQQDDTGNGYVASYDTTMPVTADAFWLNAKTITNTANGSATADTIQYVVHRACSTTGPFGVKNACIQTASNLAAGGSAVSPGNSMDMTTEPSVKPPQIHYIITARIFGPRGGNVVNQMVVLIDA